VSGIRAGLSREQIVMNNPKRARSGVALIVILILCLLVFPFSLSPSARAQNNEKMIIRRLTVLKYPLVLTVEYKGQPLKASENVFPELGVRTQVFEGDPDWLKNLTLKIKNVTDKTITYVALDLFFPQTAMDGKATGLHQIFRGIDPDRKFMRPEFHVAPNESAQIPLSSEYYDIMTLVRLVSPSLTITQITQMEVAIHAALFEDRTLFEVGTMYRRDPNNPRKWVRIQSTP
jgi:hypothetical protein